MSRSDTTCLPMRHVLRGGVSLLFRNHSLWIEFGYAVSAYSALRPDVTSLELREVLIADGKCDLTPEEFCLLVVIHSRYRVVTSLLCNRFESHTSRSMFEDIFIYMVGIKLVEIFFLVTRNALC